MTRKTVLMLVLGLVATSCLLSTVIAESKDDAKKTKASVKKDTTDAKPKMEGKKRVVIKRSEPVVIQRSGRFTKPSGQIKICGSGGCTEVSCGVVDDEYIPPELEKKMKEMAIREAAKVFNIPEAELKKQMLADGSGNFQVVMSMSPETLSPERFQLQEMVGMLNAVSQTAFDSESAAMIGIGAINDELTSTPQEAAEELESVLKTTKSLGLRNAIRITLKDIYIKAGDKKKGIEHMRAMIAENDECMYNAERNERERENRK